ncbi:glucose dehydrogenase [Nephila pilipes]|uniref:Glucose dehydrogenase n=2 Tax=Nephila pilipes TaxID=299642 RepID=A0A8X6PLR0_NEPPI|nr:glucose dehydrogenase [Nephila pilipes]
MTLDISELRIAYCKRQRIIPIKPKMTNLVLESSYPTPYATSSLLSILLLSMAGQKHTPDTKTEIKDSYDYIVVGAGSAGSVVAGRLSEKSCASVLLLEAGENSPKLTDIPVTNKYFTQTNLDWNFETTSQTYTGKGLNNGKITMSAGKTVGGSSVINGLQSIRGNKKDYNNWAAQGAVGWSFEEVLPYFKKMENNTDSKFVKNGYHGVNGPLTISKPSYESELKAAIHEAVNKMGYKFVDSNGPTQNGFFDLQATMKDGQRCSAAKAYLVPNENRENLDIISSAFVKKIIIKDRQAQGVVFEFKKKTRKVTARKEVIVSAGAINSAKLLMLSGIGPRKELEKHKIPVIADLPVGRNLQEQYGVLINFVLSNKIEPFTQKIRDDASIREYINSKSGPLTSLAGVSDVAFLSKIGVQPPDDYPDYELYFGEGIMEIVKEKYNIKPEKRCLYSLVGRIFNFGPNSPEFETTLRHSRSPNSQFSPSSGSENHRPPNHQCRHISI